MNRLRIFGVIFLVILLLCSLANGMGTKGKNIRIGITQIATHPGIDLVRNGFLDGMKERGFIENKNVTYDFQNAQGQMAVACAPFLNRISRLIPFGQASPANMAFRPSFPRGFRSLRERLQGCEQHK